MTLSISTASFVLFVRVCLWFRRFCSPNTSQKGRRPLDHQWLQDVDYKLVRGRDIPHICQRVCPTRHYVLTLTLK